MTKLDQLADLGQAIWLDYIQRSLMDSGELQAWIDKGLRGITSNPSIFEKAIVGSSDYDQDLYDLVAESHSPNEIYERLALQDIAQAADLIRPVYERTNGLDGYVSLEANPKLAHDAEATVTEINRFARALDRPNVMFKVPATPAGVSAIETLIASGINVNVTLIFSVAQYEAIAQAYIAGLEKRAQAGKDISRIASVASVFVSRMDTAVDRALEALGESELQGKIAVANAKALYARFLEITNGDRWQRLAALGARVQRVLWGSTSTKNPSYSDTLYVDHLIGADTVNTVPPATLEAFLDHGTVALTLQAGLDSALDQLDRLARLGIDLEAVAQKLQDDGVDAFIKAFESLIASISKKQRALLAAWQPLSANLGEYQAAVDQALAEIEDTRIVDRIWQHDHTVWKPSPGEITNRLGWLDIADRMQDNVACLQAFAQEVQVAGYTDALLLGMGGSSLAPEVLGKILGPQDGYLELDVLDSTDPAAVLAQTERLDPARTLFIVSTKSGGTVETLSFSKFFYNWVSDALGQQAAGEHFVAITDPGSRLVGLAQDCGFRTTFVNDPNIGGRYSALSYFGLVPAALLGLDLNLLLDRALASAVNCDPAHCALGNNGGALLGAIVSELASLGRDKLTLVASPAIAHFGDWVEQLIAESTGKGGRGILPIVGESLGPPSVYGPDRLFVHLKLGQDQTYDAPPQALQNAGHPVISIPLNDRYDLGKQFFLWEMATAIAGHRLGINPFDQPNVEAAKVSARQMVREYKETGRLSMPEPVELTGRALSEFLSQAKPGDYIALQAYVQPTAETSAALSKLRTQLRDRYRLATTVGYGPRYLHSTGQLHKGDGGNGLFIQFISESDRDAAIPDRAGDPHSSITFGVLKIAQALGDEQALKDAGRRFIRFHLGADVAGSLRGVIEHV